MRDEMLSRIWVTNHRSFADDIDELGRSLRSALIRLSTWDGTAAQLLALVAAFAITTLTFNGSGA